MLNPSLPDAINNVRDPMQNPGQTQIFYKAGQTRMTRKKVTQMTRPSFNPDVYYNYVTGFGKSFHVRTKFYCLL